VPLAVGLGDPSPLVLPTELRGLELRGLERDDRSGSRLSSGLGSGGAAPRFAAGPYIDLNIRLISSYSSVLELPCLVFV
jgi:hypothetical protein